MTSPTEVGETHSEWVVPAEHPEIHEGEVHVWRAGLEASPSAVDEFHELFSADERERAVRFRFDKHRRRFTVARGILRTLLGRYLERKPQDLTFGYSEHGKPFLAGTRTLDLRFNVSHSAEMALFGFTLGREIGVDVEQIRPDRSTREIAERFFAPREVEALFALPKEEQTNGFFRCWTRKEAYIKAKGKGLAIPLSSFAVSLVETASLVWVQDASDEAPRWRLRKIKLDGGYAGCVATRFQPADFLHWRWA